MMNNNPLVSIVTVSYNAAATIEQTILSVLNQSYSNIEYIIIDGGSTDGTVDIIKKYADKIAYWVSEPDKGIYDAMNKGIIAANGIWINFMNASDEFCSHNTIADLFSNIQNKNSKIIYGNIIRVYNNYRKERIAGITNKKPDIVDVFQDTIHHQSAFINKELFDKYDLYDLNYKLASDWLFFLKTIGINKEPVEYHNINVAYFMMDGMSSKYPEKYQQEEEFIKDQLFGDYKDYLHELSEFRKSSLLKYLLKIRILLRTFKNKYFI